MDPNQFLNRTDVEPTFGELIRQSFAFGADRLCLVKRPRDGQCATLFIVLLGDPAIREIGSFLEQHYRTLPQPVATATGRIVLQMTPVTPLRHALTWMQDNGLLYTWQKLEINQQPGAFTILTGPSVTEDLAASLTVRGLLCKLH